jgi:hypothetical protein
MVRPTGMTTARSKNLLDNTLEDGKKKLAKIMSCHVERLNCAIGTPLARYQGHTLPNTLHSRSFSPNYPSLTPSQWTNRRC